MHRLGLRERKPRQVHEVLYAVEARTEISLAS